MQDQHRKLALAALSTIIAAAVAIPLVHGHIEARRKGAGSVRIVDTSASLRELLAEDASSSNPPGGTGVAGGPGIAPGHASYPPPVVLRPLDHKAARTFFPALPEKGKKAGARYDEDAYIALEPGQSRWVKWDEHPDGGFQYMTNDYGFRESDDVRTSGVDFRVLVAGDSHVAGVVPVEDSLPNVLEALLAERFPERSVDVLNAAIGGTNAYNYLGTLERLAHLDPDVFLVVVYGGNDFYHSVQMRRYFERLGGTKPVARMSAEQLAAWNRSRTVRAQESNQVRYFMANPGDVALATETMDAVLWRIHERCRELSIELVVAYLPPPLAAQPKQYHEAFDATVEALAQGPGVLEVSDRLADNMLGFLDERGIRHLDLRPLFAAEADPAYWYFDFHINPLGHRIAATGLAPIVAELVPAAASDR